VASDGTSYLVSWSVGNVSGPSGSFNGIYAARVAGNGTVLDSPAQLIGTSLPASFFAPPARARLAHDGTGWVAVWNTLQTAANGQDVVSVVLNGSLGQISSGIVSGGTGDQTNPAIVCPGASCLVTWETSSGVVGTRWSAGAPVAPDIAIAAGSGTPLRVPVAAFDGTNWLVSWLRGPLFQPGVAQVARVSAAGVPLDPTPLTLAAATDVAIAENTAGALVVTGVPQAGTHATGVSSAGSVVSSFDLSVTKRAGSAPYAAKSASDYLIVWQDDGPGHTGIFGTRLSPSGVVRDPGAIAIAMTPSFVPRVASDGTNWLVVWQDFQSGSSYDIYGTRVSATGTVLDVPPKLIGGGSGNQVSPKVSFDGTHWLVVWGADSPPFNDTGARVAVDGTVLDPGGIPLAVGGSTQGGAVAGGAGTWLVVGPVFDGGGVHVYGQRVANDGSLLDPTPFPVTSNGTPTQARVAAAYGSAQWLVVWENNGQGTVSGARVDTSGGVLDANSIPIATTAMLPAVAFDGEDWLVAFWDGRAWANTPDLHVSPPTDVYATRINHDGVVVDVGAVAVSTDNGTESEVGLAGGDDQWLATYDLSAGPNLGVRARLLESVCTNPTDTDGDGKPDCADDCPTVPGTGSDGCPEGGGGTGGAGGSGGGAGGRCGVGGHDHPGRGGAPCGGHGGRGAGGRGGQRP
jgi:hypothetical protein